MLAFIQSFQVLNKKNFKNIGIYNVTFNDLLGHTSFNKKCEYS